tara:strand:+ start:2110 stop:3402 length:1293 start_codon:yes stop_codon:yes gene_type:complete
MKVFLISLVIILKSNFILANELIFYVDSSYKNNPRLNAERESYKAEKENIKISRSDFLPNVTISGDKTSITSTNRTNQSGVSLSDSNSDTETRTLSVDQKIFQGLEGYNTLKKSKLEAEKAKFKLKDIEQDVILETTIAYYDLLYKINNETFNLANVDIFERQVESDSIRLQKGEITLTDLAQSESSLAGANAKLIKAKTELLTAKTNFKKITSLEAPKNIEISPVLNISLPQNLNVALQKANINNPKLIMSRLDYEISKKNVQIETAKISPSASLNYSKSKKNDFSSTVDETNEESVKATITWPILSGGKNYSSIRKSKYKKSQNNLLLTNSINEVKSQTTNAWSIYQSSESVLLATEAQVKAAEIANEGITLEYDSGNTRTTLEVIQSRSLLLDARIANAKAERDLIISKFKLLSQLGELNIENIKSL